MTGVQTCALPISQKLWAQGETDASNIRQQMTTLIQREPLADIDYVSIAGADTLEELGTITPPVVVSLAVKFGRTRLIDNIVID